MENLNKEDLFYLFLGIFVSIMLIVKFGILTYILIIAIYYIARLIRFELDKFFDPSNPYEKLEGWLRKCFSLGDAVWMDNSLDDVFATLVEFCKEKKLKITFYLDQLESIASVYNNSDKDSDAYSGAAKALARIETFQKANLLKVVPKVGGDGSAKMKYFTALTKYIDKCGGVVSYISEDPELRVRIRQFMAENSGKTINIVPIGELKNSMDYFNRFKVKVKVNIFENTKKKQKATIENWKKRKTQAQDLLVALQSLKEFK